MDVVALVVVLNQSSSNCHLHHAKSALVVVSFASKSRLISRKIVSHFQVVEVVAVEVVEGNGVAQPKMQTKNSQMFYFLGQTTMCQLLVELLQYMLYAAKFLQINA